MSGGSFNPAGSSFGHIGLNHRTDSWDAETDYAEGDTVLYGDSATYYCHTDIVGDSSNDNPSVDTAHWHIYAFEEGELDSVALTGTGDLLVKEQGTVVNLPVGANGERLYFSANRRFEWFTPGISDARTALGTRIAGGTLPVSERYAAREELETVRYFSGTPIRGVSNTDLVSRSSGDFNLGDWTTIVGELKYGTFNSAGNTTLDTPLSGSQIQKDGANIGNVRNGRFYRHGRASYLGGFAEIDPRKSGTVTSSTMTATTEVPIYRDEPALFNDARSLFAANRTYQGGFPVETLYYLNLNADPDTLEWKLFNEPGDPDHDRNLYVLDYIRGVTDLFTFMCAPADDPTSTTRTIWQVGGSTGKLRTNEGPYDAVTVSGGIGYLAGVGTIEGEPSTVTTNGTRFATSDGTTRASYVQFGIMRPPQFRYITRTLTQIAVAGNYEKLFLLDEAYQFNSYFFIDADSLTQGQFLAKMQDGTWQLHNGFVQPQTLDGNGRPTLNLSNPASSTTTAMQIYPSTVVTRDHLCVSDTNYGTATATQNHWHGSTGHTDPSIQFAAGSVVQYRKYFNAWKSGQSTISLVHDQWLFTTTPTSTLTVGNSETVKQIKCFYWWGPRTGTGYGNTDNDRHPADQRLTVFSVTDEGNIWIAAQQNNDYAPYISDTARAALTVPTITATTSMAQLSGPWDGDVQRVETKCFPTSFYNVFYTGEDEGAGADPSVADNGCSSMRAQAAVMSVVVIVTSKSVFVHSYQLGATNNNGRETTGIGYCHLFYDNLLKQNASSTDFVTPTIRGCIWNNGALPSSTRIAGGAVEATWIRGDIPKGDIERVIISSSYGIGDVRLRVINDSGTMYTCNVGTYRFRNANLSFSHRLKFDIHPNNDGPITTPNNSGSNNNNRVF